MSRIQEKKGNFPEKKLSLQLPKITQITVKNKKEKILKENT